MVGNPEHIISLSHEMEYIEAKMNEPENARGASKLAKLIRRYRFENGEVLYGCQD